MEERVMLFAQRVAQGHRATHDEVRALLAAGSTHAQLVEALTEVASDATSSRGVHRALGVVRDVVTGRVSG